MLAYLTHAVVWLLGSFIALCIQSVLRDTIAFSHMKRKLFTEDDVSDDFIVDIDELESSDSNYKLKKNVYKFTHEDTEDLPFKRASKNIKVFLAHIGITGLTLVFIGYTFSLTVWFDLITSFF